MVDGSHLRSPLPMNGLKLRVERLGLAGRARLPVTSHMVWVNLGEMRGTLDRSGDALDRAKLICELLSGDLGVVVRLHVDEEHVGQP
jgi:hypothetical protein